MITRFLLLEDCGHVSALVLLAISGDLVTVATTLATAHLIVVSL